MVAQTSISPRIVTTSLTNVTAYNQAVTNYNSSIAYNQPTATNGNVASRNVISAIASPRVPLSASMKAR